MLVLSRKMGEAVVVGGAHGFEHLLKVVVVEVHGTKVRLGFEVDASVAVHRSEVWERIHAGGRPGVRPPPSGEGPRMTDEQQGQGS
jgi:carbon storage regulator CsrA